MTRTDIRVRQSSDGEDRRGSRNVGCFILCFSIQLRLSGFLSFSYLSFCAGSVHHAVTRLRVRACGTEVVCSAAVIVTRCGMHRYTVVRIGIQWGVCDIQEKLRRQIHE